MSTPILFTFLTISFFFFSIRPNIHHFMPLNFIKDCLTIVQLTVQSQTPIIVDGLRRCSNTTENLKELLWRNIVMFLIVSNLFNYIFYILMGRVLWIPWVECDQPCHSPTLHLLQVPLICCPGGYLELCIQASGVTNQCLVIPTSSLFSIFFK